MANLSLHPKSKTWATWIALAAGSLGLHRFYLHGFKDRVGWLFVGPTLLGLYGVQRMRNWGADDHWAWVLIPLLGLTLAVALTSAVVYGLTSDERWGARFNPQGPVRPTGWGAVLGALAGLALGSGVLIATLAFSAQRYFEYQLEAVSVPTQEGKKSTGQVSTN
jgi:hypothetical protein